jgi:adenine-specific DNA-methyltransferase
MWVVGAGSHCMTPCRMTPRVMLRQQGTSRRPKRCVLSARVAEQLSIPKPSREIADYEQQRVRKRHGVHYTPSELATFVATRVVAQLERETSVILDPACGDGELLLAVALAAHRAGLEAPKLVGIDRDLAALDIANERLEDAPAASVSLQSADFLDTATGDIDALPRCNAVISNPPYVRTQVLGAARAQALAQQFGLTGRVDLYHAFVAAITARLTTGGVLGLLCSNRFLTTRGGESLRDLLTTRYDVLELWDLGDTKLFEAAVLPAVLVARRVGAPSDANAEFVRVYEDDGPPSSFREQASLLKALESGLKGIVHVDGRFFNIERGHLVDPSTDRPWRLSTATNSRWLTEVHKRSAGRLSDFGPIRVGIKTTADSVFVRGSWDDLPEDATPEESLLHPLLTHRVAARWSAQQSTAGARIVLYPHEIRDGRRQAVDLSQFPRAATYLQHHRARLEGRDYVRKAGRAWYEIWVPQQPDGWTARKLVWPDISERARFFLDTSGSIVNGDCYWLSCSGRSDEEVALALAVANSSFALRYYDICCGNRLYAGRRRFITQYLRDLPMPEATACQLREITAMVDELRRTNASDDVSSLEVPIDDAVDELFGVKKVAR